MQITGKDYVFISNIDIKIVEEKFLDMVKNMWEEPIIDTSYEKNENTLDILVIKDKEMDEFSDEYAYALNEAGEGMFMLMSKKYPILQGEFKLINWREPEELGESEPYCGIENFTISVANVWSYSIILPEVIEESAFCKNIYDKFSAILRNE